MKDIEFYTYNDEVWFRKRDVCEKLTEKNYDLIDKFIEYLVEFYPEAYKSLEREYKNIIDRRFKNYRIVYRFCKCNFGVIDDVLDIDSNGRFRFERVGCPLRGECKLENICCSPKFNCKISESELRVLKLVYKGFSKEDIAEKLYLSILTVKNHIYNAYARIGVHSTAEFISYANEYNLFNKEDDI